MKTQALLISIVLLVLTACHKSNNTGGSTGQSFDSLETDVIKDFTNDVVFVRYRSLLNSGLSMQTGVNKLVNETNDENLTAAKALWKNLRADWEQSEGFLMGPVEFNDYDPNTDTWPTDYVQMDSVLASNNPLTTDDVKNLPQSLRGYHPLEYMLWGKGGSKTAVNFTTKQKQYMVSLIDDILFPWLPKTGKAELADSLLNFVTFYVRTLAVPARRNVTDPDIQAGSIIFNQINCSGCHRPTITTGPDFNLSQLSGQRIHPYTDLLLHDMGPGLADNRPDNLATGSEWKTQALWGLGLLQKTTGIAYYLHDGRARTIEEAILWHDGEAAKSKKAFTSLSLKERNQLMKFLNSL